VAPPQAGCVETGPRWSPAERRTAPLAKPHCPDEGKNLGFLPQSHYKILEARGSNGTAMANSTTEILSLDFDHWLLLLSRGGASIE
jgi:hypothetical protein